MSEIEVEIESGTLRGHLTGNVQFFLGVPYAAPPIGDRRFAPPFPGEQWLGVRDATAFAQPSLQSAIEIVDGLAQVSKTQVVGSEDCLYLNIFAPSDSGSHPVLVWIHGGGAVMGSANDVDGASLAREGVVVVTIAYRLGALGLLYLPGVFEEDADGNFAILDQVAALEWVQRNIAAFGGDPRRVTLGGQSNGARCVGTLISIPCSADLSHQAVMMSGTGVGRLVSSTEEARLVSDAVLDELSIDFSNARRLRDLPAIDIVTAQTRMLMKWPSMLPFQAVVDDVVVHERPIDAIEKGVASAIKILIGTTHDEYESFSMDETTSGPYRSLVIGDEMLATATAAYRRLLATELSDAEVSKQVLTSSDWWIPAIRVAECHTRSGGVSWMYRFDWRLAPQGQGLGAPHGIDMAVLASADTPESAVTPRREDSHRFESVIIAMRQAIVDFVTHGQPSSRDWHPYEPSTRTTFLFDDNLRVEPDPDKNLRVVWQEIY